MRGMCQQSHTPCQGYFYALCTTGSAHSASPVFRGAQVMRDRTTFFLVKEALREQFYEQPQVVLYQ